MSLPICNYEDATFVERPHTWKHFFSYRLCICTTLTVALFCSVALFAQEKNASFSPDKNHNPLKQYKVEGSFSHPVFADIDADGDLDCFSGESASGKLAKIYFFRNDGTDRMPVYRQQKGTNNPLDKIFVSGFTLPCIVDIDADGDYDCFVADGYNGGLQFYRNTGNAVKPIFEKQSAAVNPLSSVRFYTASLANATFVDIDNDGDYDCLVEDEDGNENYFRNTGTAKDALFKHVSGADDPFRGLSEKQSNNFSFYDWNKDGLTDLFINNTYYKNTGTSNMPSFAESIVDQPTFQQNNVEMFEPLRLVDINKDGNVEAFSGTGSGYFDYQSISLETEEAATAVAFSMKAYPNPSKSEFLLYFKNNSSYSTVVKISDMSGRVVTTQTTNTAPMKFGKELKPGMYVLQVLQNNKAVHSEKLVKQ